MKWHWRWRPTPRHALAATVILGAAAAGGYVSTHHGQSSYYLAMAAPPCDHGIDAHVYHPQRLLGNGTCLTITGTVELVRAEADGDKHIRVHLDGHAWDWMLNARNVAAQGGDLIVEPICTTVPTQADAVQPCSGYTNHVTVPNVGDHVSVMGRYASVDNDPGHLWAELHPVTSITER